MEISKTLAECGIGARYRVRQISAESFTAKRLSEFGLIPDTEVQCVMRGRKGGMSAFQVRGVVIALREADQQQISVELIADAPTHMTDEDERTILLVGNPNVGKSTVFNALTGLKQHTGNWCGKTVVSAKGIFRFQERMITLLDTPGTYSLESQTAEETAAAEAVCMTPHDCVICVCDATTLERGLILVLELLAMHRRVVLCVNLMDEAKSRGISVDSDHLSKRLGIPVVCTAARRKHTLQALLVQALAVCDATPPTDDPPPLVTYPIAAERAILPLTNAIAEEMPKHSMISPRWLALRLLSGNMPEETVDIASYLAAASVKKARNQADALLSEAKLTPSQLHTVCHAATVLEAEKIAAESVTIPADAARKDRLIDRIVTSRKFGIPLMLLMLMLVFWLTIVGANYPSQWLSEILMGFCGWVREIALGYDIPWWLTGALIDGAMRSTAWVVSVMLPPMAIFFPLFTLLEDAGLLPRLAMNADRCFAKCRACGKQSLTMAMGFGCNAVGVTECRIIDSRRERLIAVLTNALVPCNGRFPPRPGTSDSI